MQVNIMQMLEQKAQTDAVAARTLIRIREMEEAYRMDCDSNFKREGGRVT